MSVARDLKDAATGYRKARVARDRAIVRAAKKGITLREIGRQVGLSHTRIGQILADHRDDST